MQTTELIESLSADLRPTSGRASLRRLSFGLLLGAVMALGAAWAAFGLREDFARALFTFAFWMKWTFALGVGAAALVLCARLARPEGLPGRLPLFLAIPFLVLGVVALIEIGGAPSGERLELWLGRSALQCPWNIAALAVPIFVGVLWALRRLAPTRQRLAGFSAGCLAGSAAAVVYAIHCDETAAAFVVSWYTAGILLPGLVGILIGPRVLRW